jgi:17beta-estradiol 17-dehydrogenase / very-long-chain 3-oxoacyl-CoA reductase
MNPKHNPPVKLKLRVRSTPKAVRKGREILPPPSFHLRYVNLATMTSPLVLKSLAAFGAFAVARLTYSAAYRFYQLFVRRSTFSRYISKDPNHQSWALVTGASDGIGKAFAQELCARGANVILHGRNEAKLRRVKEELVVAYPNRSIEIAVADASKYNSKDAIAKIVHLINSLPGGRLSVVVNNVGGANSLIGHGVFHRLEDTTLDEVDKLINVNARFPALLTTALLPMLISPENGPALIFNVGSVAGVTDLPYTLVYSATKAFNLSFSASLTAEMKTEGHDIEVLGLVVCSVDTPGAPKESQNAPGCIEPNELAVSALNSVGCGESIIASHWIHWVIVAGLGLAPKSMMLSKMRENWLAEKKAK